MSGKLSVIIPSAKEIFLQSTIKDILAKAQEEIEIIAVLDGYWPNPLIEDHPNVILIHWTTNQRKDGHRGMRDCINAAVRIASGEYLMKCDAHCMFDEGFDVKLKADCDTDWLVIPRRYSLDAENWCIADTGKAPVDYHYLSYPYRKEDEVGMHGHVWTERAKERRDILIDDEMSTQGSCWFMHKDHFKRMELFETAGYGTFVQEAQEFCNKTWLSGGRVVINKKTWYAHLHKGKKYGRGYFINKNEMIKGAAFSTDFWMNNRWHKQTRPLEWLIDHFWPVPTWPENWRDIHFDDQKRLQVPVNPLGIGLDDKKEERLDMEIVKSPTEQGNQIPIPVKPEITPSIQSTLDFIAEKYGLNINQRKMPIEIPDMGRDNLPELFKELGFTIGAEIGVERGVYSEILCKGNPNMSLICIDPWQKYSYYREHVSQDKLDRFYEQTKERLAPYNATLIRKFSMDAVEDIPHESLDFVYIDGNHRLDHVVNDLVHWVPRVRKGGIVAGHDFIKTKNGFLHVVEAVWAYTQCFKVSPWFLIGTKAKIEGQIRDRARSFMWVKS